MTVKSGARDLVAGLMDGYLSTQRDAPEARCDRRLAERVGSLAVTLASSVTAPNCGAAYDDTAAATSAVAG